MKRLYHLMITILMFTLLLSITAFAGSWKQDAKGWWWDNGNGTYPKSTWQWCDGNGDGIAECYYFDGNGYCLLNTTTPDGYQVNASGAWVQDGIVQVKATVSYNPSQSTSYSSTSSNYSDSSDSYDNYDEDDEDDSKSDYKKVSLADLTKNPSKYLGEKICFSGTVNSVDSYTIYIKSSSTYKYVTVGCNGDSLRKGDSVTVYGTLVRTEMAILKPMVEADKIYR